MIFFRNCLGYLCTFSATTQLNINFYLLKIIYIPISGRSTKFRGYCGKRSSSHSYLPLGFTQLAPQPGYSLFGYSLQLHLILSISQTSKEPSSRSEKESIQEQALALQANLSALASRGSVSARYFELTSTLLRLPVPYWTYLFLAELTCAFFSLPVPHWLACTFLSLPGPSRYTEQVSAYLSIVGRPLPKPVAKTPVMSWRSLLLVSHRNRLLDDDECGGGRVNSRSQSTCLYCNCVVMKVHALSK